MIVSFKTYAAEIESSQDEIFVTDCINAAQKKIEDELGYPLEEDEYEVDTVDERIINLGHWNVLNVSVFVDGVPLESSAYILSNECYLEFIRPVKNARITFNAGWTEDNLPPAIKTAILFIAQALTKNKGAGGYTNQVNFGQGNVVFDNTRYFRFYDLIKGYKVLKL
jgi:hypothetical protein